MANEIKKSVLAFAGLKAGQQVLHDLDSIIMNNTIPDVARYGAEQICRLGSAGLAAYTIDKAVSYAEEYLPKPAKGILPLAAATIGIGTAINYFGNYFNVQEGLGILKTTAELINNYQENLTKLITFNSGAHAGYLTGAFISLKSGCRFLKNIGETITHKAEKKRAENKFKEQQKANLDIEK